MPADYKFSVVRSLIVFVQNVESDGTHDLCRFIVAH